MRRWSRSPLAPVHPQARREAEGIRFSWFRRTRVDGDSWDLAEVPLGEEAERWEIAVRREGTALRRITTAEAAWLYPSAWELADFTAPQNEIEIVIAQVSAVAGRGHEYLGRLPIR